MPNLALRGIPNHLHKELKVAAKRNHRSLNGEILARLEASVPPDPVDPNVILERVRRRGKILGPLGLSEAAIRERRDPNRL